MLTVAPKATVIIMVLSTELITMSALTGVGLAMDAFSVSLANGLGEPCMKPHKMFGIAGTFAIFQAIMPLLGWICVSRIASHFSEFQKLIPWIALFLLLYIGGKMLFDSVKGSDGQSHCAKLTLGSLMIQGVATSIDALSVGFTISDYSFDKAIVSVLIIAAVTFIICTAGLIIGRKFGTKLAGKAGILGGIILIAIGVKIFAEGVIF